MWISSFFKTWQQFLSQLFIDWEFVYLLLEDIFKTGPDLGLLVFNFYPKWFLWLLICSWSFVLLIKEHVEAKFFSLLWFKNGEESIAKNVVVYLFILLVLVCSTYLEFLGYRLLSIIMISILLCNFFFFSCISLYKIIPSLQISLEEVEDCFSCNGHRPFNINEWFLFSQKKKNLDKVILLEAINFFEKYCRKCVNTHKTLIYFCEY